MPDPLKDKARKTLRNLISQYPQYKNTLLRPLNYLDKKGDPSIFYKAKEAIDLIDSTRRLKCSNIFPHLYKELDGLQT